MLRRSLASICPSITRNIRGVRRLNTRCSFSTGSSIPPDPTSPRSSSSSSSQVVPYFEDGGGGLEGSSGPGTAAAGPIDVQMDSWSTVQRLQTAGFKVGQAEVLTDLMSWMLRVRLSEFRRALVNQARSEHDLAVFNEMFEELQASFSAAATARDSVEIRALNDKYASQLARLLDTLKDALHASRTDLAIALNAFKADSLEAAQRVGMRLHQEDGKLTVRMGAFKTGTEYVKLRAISMFSLVLCVACVVVAARAKTPNKTGKKTKGGAEPPVDLTEEGLL